MTNLFIREDYINSFPYTLVFKRNDDKFYYTNIKFLLFEEELEMFKNYSTSHYFNKTKEALDLMLQENWFETEKEANFILSKLEETPNIIIVKNKQFYEILTREEYKIYYE